MFVIFTIFLENVNKFNESNKILISDVFNLKDKQ